MMASVILPVQVGGSTDAARLERSVRDAIQASRADVAVAYWTLNGGDKRLIHADTSFPRNEFKSIVDGSSY